MSGLQTAPLAIGTTAGTAAEGSAPAAAVGAHDANANAHPGTFAAHLQNKTTNFTAAAFGRYQTVGAVTVTDPVSATSGDSYMVRIASGTATIGGVAYAPSRFDIIRFYNGSSWATSPAVLTGGLTVDGQAFPRYLLHRMQDTALFNGNASNLYTVINKTGSPLVRPLQMVPTGTVSQTRQVWRSTDESSASLYCWLHSDNYWYLSDAVGNTTDAFKAASTGTQPFIGDLTGQGTYAGTVVTQAAQTRPAATNSVDAPLISCSSQAAASSIIVPNVAAILPAVTGKSAALKLRLADGYGADTKTISVLFVVRNRVPAKTTTPTPYVYRTTASLSGGIADVASTAIPSGLLGVMAQISVTMFDQDMASPTLNGTRPFIGVELWLEYV